MEITFFESSAYIHPGDRIEFPVMVDQRIFRVEISWPLLEHLTALSPVDERRARDFMHDRREDVERVIKAHLYAQGVPASGYLNLAPDDFDAVGRMAQRVHAVP
jgi:hypothetical protein